MSRLSVLQKFKPLLYVAPIALVVAGLLYFASDNNTAEAQWLAGQSGEAWQYRQQLTINNASSSEDLIDFPMLITLTPSRVTYTDFAGDGRDIRFTDTNGDLLDYEIEKWDSTATSTIWVRIPQITNASTGEYIYMYYGNDNASDAQNPEGVWDDNYGVVQHLEDGDSTDADFYTDSTRNANHGQLTDSDGDATAVTGKIDGALNLNADASDSIAVADANSLDVDSVTVQAWVYLDAYDDTYDTFVGKGNDIDDSYSIWRWRSGLGSSGVAMRIKEGASIQTVSSNEAITASAWYFVVGTYDEETMRIYVNGVEKNTNTTPSGAIDDNSESLFIGDTSNDTNFEFDGTIDEVRVSSIARSAEWIEAEYRSHRDNMLTYGSKENSPAPVGHWKFDEGVGSRAYDESGNDADGYYADWKYKRTLTFNNASSSENLTDFPVLVRLTPDTFDYAKARGDGYDLRFIDDNGTTSLPFEIESWDATATSSIWVRVPQIDSAATDDTITMYYGNPGASLPSDPTTVWDNDYALVQHLEEGDSTGTDFYKDSTGSHNDGTLTDSDGDSASATGQINGAFDFNGDADLIDIGDKVFPTGAKSIEAWVALTDAGTNVII